jgi:nucleoside-diphosphate-sugar epimerase
MASSQFGNNTERLVQELSNKSIFVAGAGGFIGSSLLELLTSLAADVRALLGAPGETVWDPPPQTKAFFGDLRDTAGLAELMQGADIAIHAAGPPSVRASFEQPKKCAGVHVLGTIALMQACQAAGVRRVVYISSAEVYGCPACNPVCEDAPMEPISPYGAAKSAAEMFVRILAAQAKMEYCILRPFSVFGPRQSSGSVIATILSQSPQGQAVHLNDLSPVRDYCYVRDVAEAIALACVADVSECTCNIGSGIGTSVQELAETILSLHNASVPIRKKVRSDRPEGTEIYELVANIEKARGLLGWQPRTPLATGLRETIAWARQHAS